MRVFIPSYNRANAINSHRLFAGCDVTVVLQDEQQVTAYREAGHVNDGTRIVTSNVKGIAAQREFIHNELATEGEWYVSIDDNVKALTGVPKPYYDEPEINTARKGKEEFWRTQFSTQLLPKQFMEMAEDTVRHAEEVGAHYCTMAVVDNAYFRQQKFRYVGATVGKLAILHRSIENKGFWDKSIVAIDDYQYGAEQVFQHGKVVINNFIFPKAKHYQAGGLGTYSERSAARRGDVERLMNTYPDYFRVKDRKGFDAGTELAVRLTSAKQVEQWRAQMRAIRGNSN